MRNLPTSKMISVVAKRDVDQLGLFCNGTYANCSADNHLSSPPIDQEEEVNSEDVVTSQKV